MSTVSLLPKARSDVRKILTIAGAQRSIEEHVGYAAQRWGHSVAADIEATLKAAIAPVATGDLGGNLPGIAVGTLLQTALERSVQRSFFPVPFNVPLLASSGDAAAYWVGEARPRPLTRTQLTATRLSELMIGAIEVFTLEALRAVGDAAEGDFQRRLQRAIVRLLDQTFLDPAASAVAGVSPASITNGLTPIAYAGDLVESVGNLFEAYAGDPATAVLMTDSKTGWKLGTATNGSGAVVYPDAGARGGTISGIPLLVTRGSPRDSSGGQLVIADTAQVGVALGELRVDRSTQTTLEMSDSPTDPVTASTVLISLFQSDLAALRLQIGANWQTMQEGAVAMLAGIP